MASSPRTKVTFTGPVGIGKSLNPTITASFATS